MQIHRRTALSLAAAWAACGSSLKAIAQTTLGKPIKMIVAFAPGASNDVLGRLLTTEFSKGFAPGSLVENHPGAGGVLAAQLVSRAAPDGATLLIVSFPFPLINSVYTKSKLDVTRDFLPVATLCTTPNVIAVRADSPLKNMADLIEQGRRQPGKLSFSSTGIGTSPHLGMELIQRQTGTKFNHVPYKGSAPALTDLLAGQIDFTMDNLLNVLPYLRAGKMRAFAVTTSKRADVVPEVPTLAEAGVPGVVMDIWIGVVTVAGTPAATVGNINQEINRILDLKEVRERFTGLGMTVLKGPPEQLGSLVNADVAKWGKVVREANISVE